MDKTISREMGSFNNLIKRFLDKNTALSKISELSCTNVWIIAYIAANGDKDIFQKDLERDFGITRSTASRVVDLMVQKGLLERHSVSYDARLKKLLLTPKADDITEKIKYLDEGLNLTLREGISDEELEIFFGCIEKMKSNLERRERGNVNDKEVG